MPVALSKPALLVLLVLLLIVVALMWTHAVHIGLAFIYGGH